MNTRSGTQTQRKRDATATTRSQRPPSQGTTIPKTLDDQHPGAAVGATEAGNQTEHSLPHPRPRKGREEDRAPPHRLSVEGAKKPRSHRKTDSGPRRQDQVSREEDSTHQAKTGRKARKQPNSTQPMRRNSEAQAEQEPARTPKEEATHGNAGK